MTMKRSWLFFAVLGGVAVLPYLASSSSGLRGMLGRAVPPPSVDDNLSLTTADAVGPLGPGANPTSPQHVPVRTLEDVFRFDVTTAWILGHWPRVSAGLAEIDTQGYRVPLVTGTSEADLAGALTYYFNPKQQIERITFNGATGDTRRLVALLTSRFGFHREATDDPSLFLYQVKDDREVISELKIKPTRIVRNDAPHSRFEVALRIQRPK